MGWESAERVQKNEAGQYRALMGGEWVPVERAQKSAAGQYRVMLSSAAPPTPHGPNFEQRRTEQDKQSSRIVNTAKSLDDLRYGLSSTTRNALNLFPGSLGDRLFAPPEGPAPNPTSVTLGKFADPLPLVTGLGAAKILPYAKVLGGGLKAGTAAVVKNIVGGAAPGAVIGGLSDEGSAASGATWGAVLNSTVPPFIRALGGVVVKAWAASSAQWKARNMLVDVLGDDLPAFKAAMQRSPKDLTAAQAASGINNDLVDAMDGLARRMDERNYFSGLDRTQRAALVEGLVRVAGGRNQTDIKRAAELATQALGETTEPLAQEALASANEAGRLLPKLTERADRLGEAASSKVQDVRRLSAAQQSAAAADSLILGAGSRDARMRAASLAQNGLKPLDTGKLTGKLRGMLRDPSIGPSDVNEKVLSKVAEKIDEWTAKNGGVIDAKALRTIRISAVNDAVEGLMSGADPKAKARTAAGLLTRVKPAIDDAIVEAGGTGWREYLFSYERGSRLIARRKMAGAALGLLEKEPAKLESLAAGNEPQLVKKIFKTEYDLGLAMGTKDNVPIKAAAAAVARDRLVKEGGARGDKAMLGVLERHRASFVLPNWINAKIAVTNRALKEVEFRVNKKTMDAVYEAMKSGENANNLLSVVPIQDRNAAIKGLLAAQDDPKTRAFLMGLINGMEQ